MDYSTPVLGRSLTPGDNRPSCCGASRPWRASCGDRSYRSCGGCWRNCPTTFLHLSRLPAHRGALVPRSGCVLAPLPSARLSYLAPTGLRTPAPRIGTGSTPLIRSTPITSLPRTRPERHRSDAASRRTSRTRAGIGSGHSYRRTSNSGTSGELAICTTRTRTAKNAKGSTVWSFNQRMADRCDSSKSRAIQTTVRACTPAR